MKRKVHVNDELSPNSIFLVGKVTGNEVVFLRDPVFVHVLDGTLQSIFGTSSERLRRSSDTIGTPRKILALSG